MLTLAEVIARIQRLDELTRGLAKEVLLWRDVGDPLLYLERKAYLNAIQDGLAAMESARVVLAQARQRIEEETNHETHERHEKRQGQNNSD
jgi:hypothetical protein